MKTPRRIYLVCDQHTGDEALVRAASAAQALRHIVRLQFTVKAATAENVAALMGANPSAKVQDAGDDHAPLDMSNAPAAADLDLQ